MPYIPFTDEQKRRANQVDLEEFLRLRGETLIRSGREQRMESDHSVTIRGNQWYDHPPQRGGGPVSFLQTRCGLSYPEAMSLLLAGEAGQVYPAAKPKPAQKTPFVLPPPAPNLRRMYAYLCKRRKIAPEMITYFVRAKLLYEDARHNCVFVGTDENGMPRHAHKRSANSFGKPFRGNVEGSDPRYSFHHLGTGGQLFVFEAPIDLLSYLTLYPEGWRRHSYVACCGTSFRPAEWMLSQMERPEEVLLCLDNDDAGQQACQRMEARLAEMGLASRRLVPERKDWNEDLTQANQQEPSMNMTLQF